MSYTLNPDIIEIRLSDSEPCILKLGKRHKFITLSLKEYEVLKKYATSNNISDTIAFFRHEIEISQATLKKLIAVSTDNELLLEKNARQKPKNYISLFGIGFTWAAKRKGVKLEVLHIDLTQTAFEKFIEKKAGTFILCFLALFTLYAIFSLCSSPLHFRANYMETVYKVPYSFSHLLPFIFAGSMLSLCLHELGHHLVYKTLRGKTSIFGFGLQYFFFPLFYNKILTSLIRGRKQRIFINTAGILFDAFQVIFILYFTRHFHLEYPTISFLLYGMLCSIGIRTFFNLNIFLTGSDGYFILQDLFNIDDLNKTAYKRAKEFLKRGKAPDYRSVLSLLFVALNILSIIISFLFIFLPFILYGLL